MKQEISKFGGQYNNNERTSEFLPAGTMQWQEGPALPVEIDYPCVVVITSTSFLSIFNRNIHEFDAAISGPTSSEGWKEAGAWPTLMRSRKHVAGCAKLGQKVIIAGGTNGHGGSLTSTEVLDLVNRRITSGGDMDSPRRYFHLATLTSEGQEKIFALGGYDDSTRFNSVEEWVEESSTWKAADNLVERRGHFGAVVLPRQLICPV